MTDVFLIFPLPLADADDVLRVLIFVLFGAVWLIAQAIAVAKKRSNKQGKTTRDQIAESIRRHREEAAADAHSPTQQEIAAERRRREQLVRQSRRERARAEDDLVAQREAQERQAQVIQRRAEENARREHIRREQQQREQARQQQRRPAPRAVPTPVPAVVTAGSTDSIQSGAIGRGRHRPISGDITTAEPTDQYRRAQGLRRRLQGKGVREAVLLSEILSPPLSLRQQNP